jgi:ATP-binding cassette subfamily F protein 3
MFAFQFEWMINITNLSLSFGDRTIFDDISFTIKTKDKIGVVGRNGAGKTTLFRIIAGLQSADGGKIDIPNGKTIGYLQQDIQLNQENTVMNETLTVFSEVKEIEDHICRLEQEIAAREDYDSEYYHNKVEELADYANKLAILGSNAIEATAGKILYGLGFKANDFSRKISEFSGGWQMRIVLAKLLLSQPDFVLLDEPTNHLDIESIIWLERFLQDYPGAVLLISHDKQFLDRVTQITLEIEMGKMHFYKANYSDYLRLRQDRQEKLIAAYRNQQRVIAEKERTITRFMAKESKTKLAQSMQKKLEKMDRIELDEFDTRTIKLQFPEAERAGQVVLDIRNLTKHYGSIRVLENVNLQMDRGDRLAFVGQNGQGKTTLARIIVGELEATSGEASLGHKVTVGYYAQNQSVELDPSLTVLETMEQNSPMEMRTKLRHILGAFLFSGEDVEKKVSVLSGGERARVSIAVMLLRPFNFLVMDEPTNHLDILSKEVLKNALLDYQGSVIVVSHDRDFLSGLTNRTIEFREKKLYDYPGDVNYFLQKRDMQDMREVEKRTEKNDIQPTSSAGSKMSYEDRKEILKTIRKHEKEIEVLENAIVELEKLMHDPRFYNSPDSADTLKLYNAQKASLDKAYENWAKAQERLEQ